MSEMILNILAIGLLIFLILPSLAQLAVMVILSIITYDAERLEKQEIRKTCWKTPERNP